MLPNIKFRNIMEFFWCPSTDPCLHFSFLEAHCFFLFSFILIIINWSLFLNKFSLKKVKRGPVMILISKLCSIILSLSWLMFLPKCFVGIIKTWLFVGTICHILDSQIELWSEDHINEQWISPHWFVMIISYSGKWNWSLKDSPSTVVVLGLAYLSGQT